MHQAQIHAESVLFVCPALSFVKSLHRFPSYRPSGRSFCILVSDTPGPEFVGNSRERARRSPARGFQRFDPPLGPPESRPRRWEFRTAKRESRLRRPDFFTAKCESRQRRSDFFTAKCESRLPRPDFFTAKRESRQRRSPLPGRAFSAARPAGTARFLITRGKASFYETATFGRRKVFFCSPFCGLLFCPTRAKLALPAGEKPAAPKPRPPRGGPPNDRDRLPVFAPPARTPAPATPPQSACSRRLSGRPQRPNLSARRRAESPKGKRKGGTPDETRTAALTTAPPEDGWEGSQPKRAQRRGKPAKQPRRSAS